MKRYLQILISLLFLAHIAKAQADLVVSPGTLSVSPGSVHVGITIDITFSVQNIGNASSETTITGLYLSVSTDPAAGVFLGNISLESLAAGASSNNIQCRFPIPYTIGSSGTFNLIVKLNPYQTISESSYSNNSAFVPLNIDATPWAAQNIPYPIIFVHGLTGDNTAWSILIDSLQNFYGWSYGGNMNFCLNYDGDNSTANENADYHDFTNNSSLMADDFYTVNFDVDNTGNWLDYQDPPNSLLPVNDPVESNQAAIVKQGLAIQDAIKRVLAVTGRDKVILVCHSMGGLAAREYLQNENLFQSSDGKKDVAKLFTIGTPHGGSNSTDFGFFSEWLPDPSSEAMRDLRTNYFYSGYPGAYLFGGHEDNLYMLDQVVNFYNVDVNCNGVSEEWIEGINDKPIPPDISYSCIIGVGNVLGGDGVVATNKANINNYVHNQIYADTFILKQPSFDLHLWHTELPKQFKGIMKGLDESNSWVGAYQISSGQLYYGLITEQSKGNSVITDYDTYIINIPSNGTLNIQLYNAQLSQFRIQVYNSSHTPVYSTSSNGKSYINVTTPSLAADNYYVAFYGTPASDSWYYPYAFKLTYSPVTPSYCSGTTNLTAPSGIFSDGSGNNNYNNNSDCKWKIQPSGATSITLSFPAFDVINPGDTVYVYDGGTTASPLLLSWTGNTLPSDVTSTGGTMLVRFSTDAATTAAGWTANYTSVTVPTYCNGTTTLTSASGAFSDGSGTTDYGNNSHCSWLISPAGAFSVTLNFLTFNTEAVNDIVNVYDGNDNTATLLGSFSGSTIPSSITSSGGAMFVEFITNNTITASGWNASYTSYVPYSAAGIVEYEYWFDNSYASAVSTPVMPQTVFHLNLNISSLNLSPGLHTYNIRFKDNNSHWSSAVSNFFYKPNTIYPAGSAQYEYWFDNNYAAKNNINISNTNNLSISDNIATSGLTDGLHTVNSRFKPDGKNWSSTIASFFYKTDVSPSGTAQYEYWFDNNYANKSTITISSTNNFILLDNIVTSGTNKGLHTLNFRSKPDGKKWSSVTSSFFYKDDSSNVAINNLAQFVYWYDNNWQTPKTISIIGANNISWTLNSDVTELSEGRHNLSMSFKDDKGKWSSIVSDSFTRAPVPSQNCLSGNRSFGSGVVSIGSSYQWQVNTGTGFANISNTSIYSGANNDTLQLINAPTSWYGYKYRCLVTNGNDTTTGETRILKFSMIWNGSINNLWETPANWSCGYVPDANTDVYINASMPSYPEINSNVSCRSLHLQPGTSLDVKPGFRVDVTGRD